MTARPIFTEKFTGNFTQQEPLPAESITAATNVLNHGRLHRYNTLPDEIAETALLEQEFAEFTKAKYCLAVASCGYALTTALRALQVKPNDPILTNAFTLAPVPGAIAATNARPDIRRNHGKPNAKPHRFTNQNPHIKRQNPAIIAHAGAYRGHGGNHANLQNRANPDNRRLRPHDGGGLERRGLWQIRRHRLLFHANLQTHQFGRGRADDNR